MGGIAWLLLAGGVVWFFLAGRQAQERAERRAKLLCRRLGVQFLDGTVVLRRLRIKRLPQGQLGWVRDYSFDFSRDNERRETAFLQAWGGAIRITHFPEPPASDSEFHPDL